MYRDLVFRPGVDSTTVETMPYNPSVDRSFVETLPYRTPPGPGSGGGIVADRPTDYGIDEIPRTASVDAFGPEFMNKIEAVDEKSRCILDLFIAP
jgi:hypothetical protein